MNYGRFFRLNQSISKVVDGVAIYDYIDLPAYFGPSEENKMSPKYPVNVTITSNSVIFRLHYSVYKVSVEGKPTYGYNVEDIKDYIGSSAKGAQMAHMEEVIFELPYYNDSTNRLTATIKELYNTKFPQKIETEGHSNSSGGRFLEQLIRKRFPAGGEIKAGAMEKEMYGAMQKALDTLPSYSTLWLMDMQGSRLDSNEKFIDIYEKKGKSIQRNKNRDINGFLRKLLLDFMFDLKHSDIFQNSACYQQMYSGLMSDFFFSALMHKCEYYYYRVLVTEEIKKKNTDKRILLCLYANNLSTSEELWIQDIMSPNAERFFDYSSLKVGDDNNNNRSRIDNFLVQTHILEDNQFVKRNSWFAEPEEEMRRVCFPMDEIIKDKKGGKEQVHHICNVSVLLDYLSEEKNDEDYHVLKDYTHRSQELISRWFLKRYDFNDVCHLHLSRRANIATFSILFTFMILFLISSTLSEKAIEVIDNKPYLPTILLFAIFLFVGCWFWNKGNRYNKDGESLMNNHIKKNSRRITAFMVVLSVFILGISKGYFLLGILFVFIILLFFSKSRQFVENELRNMTSYLHLLFPRLIASITTAWLTMSLGFDLYAAFFDKHVSWPTAIMIIAIVFVFVMYELNRITQRCDIWKKIVRSIQLVTISYGISLVVGSIVIDFLGRQYMERGGPYDDRRDFIMQYYPGTAILSAVPFDELPADKQVEVMENVRCEKGCRSIQIFHLGEHEVFFMRDFLIMFSFVTMFMGVFLQMFIFDEKKMTEF